MYWVNKLLRTSPSLPVLDWRVVLLNIGNFKMSLDIWFSKYFKKTTSLGEASSVAK